MQFDPDDPRWTAYVLGELDAAEAAPLEQELEHSPSARQFVEELRQTIGLLTAELESEPALQLTAEQRTAIDAEAQLAREQRLPAHIAASGAVAAGDTRRNSRWLGVLVAVAASLLVVATLVVPGLQNANAPSTVAQSAAQPAARSARPGEQWDVQGKDGSQGRDRADESQLGRVAFGNDGQQAGATTGVMPLGDVQTKPYNLDVIVQNGTTPQGETKGETSYFATTKGNYTVVKPVYEKKTKDIAYTIGKPVSETKSENEVSESSRQNPIEFSQHGRLTGTVSGNVGDQPHPTTGLVPAHPADPQRGVAVQVGQSSDEAPVPIRRRASVKHFGGIAATEGKDSGDKSGGGNVDQGGDRFFGERTGRFDAAAVSGPASGSGGNEAKDFFSANPSGAPSQPGKPTPVAGGTVVLYDGAQPKGLEQLADGEGLTAAGRHNWTELRTRLSVAAVDGTEAYDEVTDNAFLTAADNPLSTFSIDVDTASYSNVRRFITKNHRLPPKSAVRIEEMLNYFSYDYPQPEGEAPFAANAEVAECPWNARHRLVRIGLKGREIAAQKRPPSNLVFLVDVSGSMNEPNKLPLVKQSLRMLAEQLTENDRVAIVVYAGNSGLVLPSTTGNNRETITTALDRLEAGGSTNGGEGIQLAYEIALRNFLTGGTNRVILATDGDFNVGITDRGKLVEMIQQQAASGVFLTTLGYGFGNLKDATLEQLADKGNGAYAYIDDAREAKKVFVEQMSGTLVTIAKDVKIQIEFNPAQVGSYRLVGYENRILAHEDFNNDAKDAGDIGAGHTVTALYEIVPPAAADARPTVDPLKYQAQNKLSDKAGSGELLTLKLRYKQPDGQVSKLLEYPVKDSGNRYGQATRDFKFAAAVATFGMLLRDSPHKGSATMAGALELAQEGQGSDEKGYRQEFVSLIQQAKAIYDATHPSGPATVVPTGPIDEAITHAGPVPVAGEPVGDAQPLVAGDAVLVEWGGSWWQATVVEAVPDQKPDGSVKIHYRGWEPQWDEVVPRARLRK